MSLHLPTLLSAECPGDRTTAIKRYGMITAILSLVGTGFWLWQQPSVHQLMDPELLAATIHRSGPFGPALYIAVIVVSVVIAQIPGAPLAVVAGAIWGPWLAGLYTILGGFSGAIIAYALGRSIGASLVQAVTGKTFQFSEQVSESRLGWLIFGTRLVPVLPFDLVSYAAGIAKLSLPVYASATLLGMVPSTLLLTFVGSNAHPTGSFMVGLLSLFALLFAGIPLLITSLTHRYEWLNLKAVVSGN